LSSVELRLLRILSKAPLRHLDIQPAHRGIVTSLWRNGFVSLNGVEDTWRLSPKGHWVLDGGGRIH